MSANQPIFFDSQTKAALLKLSGSMDELIASINRGADSADRAARRLVALTVALVVLTVLLVVLTVVLIVRDAKSETGSDAVGVVRAYLASKGSTNATAVAHVDGSFVLVSTKAGRCFLIDTATPYKQADGEVGDRFWTSVADKAVCAKAALSSSR